jgi:GTP pyrophosphokinase
VPLNTPLETGQQVEIITAKIGGPSRDWLNPTQGYIHTKSARVKVRPGSPIWPLRKRSRRARADRQGIAARRPDRAQYRRTGAQAGFLAGRRPLHCRRAGRTEPAPVPVGGAGGDLLAETLLPDEVQTKPSKPVAGNQGILIVGVDKLLTQLARCCKPAPPDEIQGFITRGKGISIHRMDCPILPTWRAASRAGDRDGLGLQTTGVFATDIVVDAHDRQGLLRDISEIFTREKLNVIGVNTQSKQGKAHMSFTVEITNLQHCSARFRCSRRRRWRASRLQAHAVALIHVNLDLIEGVGVGGVRGERA